MNSATICGIAVIFTLRAETAPITVPTAIPTMMSQYESIAGEANVNATAIDHPRGGDQVALGAPLRDGKGP